MKKMFLKVLAIVLMASGLQINQVKAKVGDQTPEVIGGEAAGVTALLALIVYVIKQRFDVVNQKDFIHKVMITEDTSAEAPLRILKQMGIQDPEKNIVDPIDTWVSENISVADVKFLQNEVKKNANLTKPNLTKLQGRLKTILDKFNVWIDKPENQEILGGYGSGSKYRRAAIMSATLDAISDNIGIKNIKNNDFINKFDEFKYSIGYYSDNNGWYSLRTAKSEHLANILELGLKSEHIQSLEKISPDLPINLYMEGKGYYQYDRISGLTKLTEKPMDFGKAYINLNTSVGRLEVYKPTVVE